MYSVGRIEDSIKKGKIMDTWQSRLERKGMSPISMMKNEAEENSRQWENLLGTSFTHILHVSRCPQPNVFRLKFLQGKVVEGLTQAVTKARKGKGPKCTTHFRCPLENCFPYCSKIMGFLSFPQDQEEFHIRKDTILMPDVITTEELEGILRKIIRPSRTRSNP